MHTPDEKHSTALGEPVTMLERIERQPCGPSGKEGDLATRAICVNCERTVYLEENETGSCPVCSSPVIPSLVETSTPTLEGYYFG